MRSLITKFIKDDAGAVTVDFVVLTAVALSFTLGVYKWFVIDPEKSAMGLMVQDGEVKQVIFVADNGLSKIMATAQFHVTAFVSCIFGSGPEVDSSRCNRGWRRVSLCDGLIRSKSTGKLGMPHVNRMKRFIWGFHYGIWRGTSSSSD